VSSGHIFHDEDNKKLHDSVTNNFNNIKRKVEIKVKVSQKSCNQIAWISNGN
jgi:hypothetical protein